MIETLSIYNRWRVHLNLLPNMYLDQLAFSVSHLEVLIGEMTLFLFLTEIRCVD